MPPAPGGVFGLAELSRAVADDTVSRALVDVERGVRACRDLVGALMERSREQQQMIDLFWLHVEKLTRESEDLSNDDDPAFCRCGHCRPSRLDAGWVCPWRFRAEGPAPE